MSKFFIGLVILLISSIMAEEWPKIYNSESKGWVSWETLEKSMANSDVVYVGELHNHIWGHKVELMLLEKLFSSNPNVAIALEMFERDVQNVLDGYLADEVNEAFFLRNSRPWPNYIADYRPLIEFARIYHLPALAMNVPRRYASFVSKDKEQALASMPEAEKEYMAEKIIALKGKYRDKFYEIMGGHVPAELVEKYYRSQCLKDDTMAKSIVSFLKDNPNTTVISYTGSFHSDEALGLVEKVDGLLANVKKIVISIIPTNSSKINPAEYANQGDFILFAPENKAGVKKNIVEQILKKLPQK